MLIRLKFSQRLLTLSSLFGFTFLFSFCCSDWEAFPSSILPLIPYKLFFISVSIHFISDQLFFMFSMSFLVLSKFIYSSPEFTEHLYNQCFELCIYRLSPFCLVLFLKFCSVLSFGTCFFVFSFWQLPCVRLYVLGRPVMFLRLGRVAQRGRCPISSTGTVPGSPELGTPGVPPVWAMYTLLLYLSFDCCWNVNERNLPQGQLPARTGCNYHRGLNAL